VVILLLLARVAYRENGCR